MVPKLWVLCAALLACFPLIFATGVSASTNPLLAPTFAPGYASSSDLDDAPYAAAAPSTSASIAPSLSPDRHRARAALTFTIDYTGGELGVPSPVRKAVLGLPAGLTLAVPVLRSCTATILLAHGIGGCPAQSEIGSGHALVIANLGTQILVEHVALWAFLAPPRDLQPTFVILAEGYAPLSVKMVLPATALPARAPYGEDLTMSVPPIPTVPNKPDASVVNFTLTIGATARRRTQHSATVTVPSHCPRGGLPFAAAFTYANGSQDNALATIPCPT
jgi:hypothetical protein